MIGTAMIALVRDQTLLDSDDISDAKILAHLNRGIEIVGARFDWPWLEDEDDIAVSEPTQAHAFPTGAVKIDAILENATRTRLRKVSSTEAWERYGDDPPTASPKSFHIWQSQVVLVEIPSADVTLHVKFHKQPTLMADATKSPEWNSQYHEFLVDYAAAKLWEREEDLNMASEAAGRFDQGIGDLANFYNDQGSDARMVWGEQPDRFVGAGAGNMPWLNGV